MVVAEPVLVDPIVMVWAVDVPPSPMCMMWARLPVAMLRVPAVVPIATLPLAETVSSSRVLAPVAAWIVKSPEPEATVPEAPPNCRVVALKVLVL
jgi:hypothetical protein